MRISEHEGSGSADGVEHGSGPHLQAGATCRVNNDCASEACAWSSVTASTYSCCASGEYSYFKGSGWYYYCTDLPSGTPCWSSSHGACKSKSCLAETYWEYRTIAHDTWGVPSSISHSRVKRKVKKQVGKCA
jgi:hypothetical protein